MARSPTRSLRPLLFVGLALVGSLARPAAAAPPSRRPPNASKCADTIKAEAPAEEILQQGQCNEMQGHLVRALELYRLTLRRLPSRTLAAKAQERIDVVVPQLASLRVDSARLPPGSQLTIDGQPFELDARRKIDPGSISLEVTAPGFYTHSQVLDLLTGEDRALSVVLKPEPSEPRPHRPAAPTGLQTRASSSLQPIGYVLLAVSGASLVAGGVTGYATMDRARFVERECPQPASCSPEGVAAASAGSMFGTLSTTSLVGGAVLGLVGAALVLLAPSRHDAMLRPSVGGVALTVEGL